MLVLLTSCAGHRDFDCRPLRECTAEFVVCTMLLCLGPLTEMVIADYNASKAATISLHESLRYELDKRCVYRSQITNRHLTLASQLSRTSDPYQSGRPRPHSNTSFLNHPTPPQLAFPLLLPFLGADLRCKSDYPSVGRAALADDLLTVLC